MNRPPRLETNQRPIVVVSGLPRSGTSLMMQMLAAGGLPICCDAARPADASNPHGYYELAAVKNLAKDASFLAAAAGHGVKIIAPLLPFLPAGYRYRVIFLTRDLERVVASQQAMLQRLGLPDDSDRATLIAMFRRQLAAAQALIAAHPAAESLVVAHEDCLERPQQVAAQVARFVGLPGERCAAMAAAVDPLLVERRRTPDNGSR